MGEISNLVKKYDDKFKLGEINLEIPSGCIIGLIGENGAGKTTLIKSILNIINIDSGNIKIFGKNNKREEKIIKKDIGVVLDNMFFPEILMSKDIDMILKDVYDNWDRDLFYKYLDDFNIPKDKKIKDLSNLVAGTKFALRVPVSNVKEDNKELQISVLGSFDTFAANKYVYKGTENAPSQTVTNVKRINNNLSAPLSIQLNYTPTVPNTAMSNSTTLFFIGIILLLSGLGIFYTSAKKD